MKQNAFKVATLLVASMFVSISAFAQQETKEGPFVTNQFKDNWFISVGAGVQKYLGEYSGKAKPSISPAFDLSVGKWLTPVWGLRLQVAGLQTHTASLDPSNPWATGKSHVKDGKTYYDVELNYLQYHMNVMFNMSAAFWGYKPDRTYEFVPYIGGGGMSLIKGPSSNEITGVAGFLHKIRLSDRFDVNVDMRGVMFAQGFEQQYKGSIAEGTVSVTAGFTYKFGTKPFKSAADIDCDYSPFNNRINALENELKAAKTRQANLEKQLADEKNKKTVTPVSELQQADVDVDASTAVFFELNKADISDEGKILLDKIVDPIKSSDKKYVLTGYADKETGTANYNMTLSQKRAQAVHDYLVSKGVPASKLDVVAKGGSESPYNKPYLCRVVIVAK